MNEKKIKLSFIERYRYLYLNAPIVLGDYFYQSNSMKNVSNLPNILFFLLGDSSLEETKFYKTLQLYKQSEEGQRIIQSNLGLLKESSGNYDMRFYFWTILSLVRDWLVKNTSPSLTRRLALQTLDEYFRVLRYDNDGKSYKSGYYLKFEDIENCHFHYLNPKCQEEIEYQYTENSSYESYSNFISFFSETKDDGTFKQGYQFTDLEIEKIYISLHDQLPYRLFKECSFELEDTVIERPKNTQPCHFQFRISEENIFTDNLGNFYQLCPNCGYINLIDEGLIPDSIQDRIIARCKMNPEAKRINFITSEIINIEFRSKSRTRILNNNRVINNT